MSPLLLLTALVIAAPRQGGPQDAVVRITSHGVSATVIHTEPGKTFLLGCCHAYDPIYPEWEWVDSRWMFCYRGGDLLASWDTRTKQFRWFTGGSWGSPVQPPRLIPAEDMLHKRMTFDIPAPTGWPGLSPNHSQKVIALDKRLDLSLVEIGYGPFPYFCPVAGAGYPGGKNFASVGYDEMRLPAKFIRTGVYGHTAKVHVLKPVDTYLWVTDNETTFTREPPWHGRSGGALIDLDAGLLVAVCGAYNGDPKLARYGHPGGGPGIYTSHKAIEDFIKKSGWQSKK